MKKRFPYIPFAGFQGVFSHIGVFVLLGAGVLLFFLPDLMGTDELSLLRWLSLLIGLLSLPLINQVFFTWIEIDTEGIRFHSLFSDEKIPWEKLTGMAFYRTYGRSGMGTRIAERDVNPLSAVYIAIGDKEKLVPEILVSSFHEGVIMLLYREEIVAEVRRHRKL